MRLNGSYQTIAQRQEHAKSARNLSKKLGTVNTGFFLQQGGRKEFKMEYQEKVALLKKYKEAMKIARYCQEEVDQYRETKAQAKSQQITDMPIAHGIKSDLSDYIVTLDEIKDKMFSNLLYAQRMKLNILVWTESLEDVDERLIINYHYIQGKTFKWISEELKYHERQVMRKLKKAIENLPDPDFESKWI